MRTWTRLLAGILGGIHTMGCMIWSALHYCAACEKYKVSEYLTGLILRWHCVSVENLVLQYFETNSIWDFRAPANFQTHVMTLI